MTGREQHLADLNAARDRAIEMELVLVQARRKQEEFLAALIACTGDEPATEPGRIAQETAVLIGRRLDESIGRCGVIGAELIRYEWSI